MAADRLTDHAGATPWLASREAGKHSVRTAANARLARLSNAASRLTDTRSTRLETDRRRRTHEGLARTDASRKIHPLRKRRDRGNDGRPDLAARRRRPHARASVVAAIVQEVIGQFACRQTHGERGGNSDIGAPARRTGVRIDHQRRGRRGDVGRRHDPRGNGHDRHDLRQEEVVVVLEDGRRRRLVPWRRRGDEDRGRERRRGVIVIDDVGTIEIDLLGRRRRRIVVGDHVEGRRRFERRLQARQAAARLSGVRTARIPLEIGPVGVLGIDIERATPGARLAPRRQQTANVLRVGAFRKGGDEILVALHGVTIDHGGIGERFRQLVDRLGAFGGELVGGHGRRRRISGAFQQGERRLDLAGAPRHLRRAGQFRGSGANANKNLLERQAGLAQHFAERLRIGAIGFLARLSPGPGRGVEGHDRTGVRLDDRQSRRKALNLLAERAGVGDVQKDHASASRRTGQGTDQVGQANSVEADVRVAGNGRAGRDEVILAVELQAIAREIDDAHRAGAGCRHLGEKLSIGGAQRILIEVARAGHVELRRLQGVRHKRGVIGGGRERRAFVGVGPDDKSEARLALLRGRGGERPKGG